MYIHRQAEQIIDKNLAGSKVIILLGARQVGKTTLIEHVLKNRHAVVLNFDIEIDKARFGAASSLAPKEAISTLGNPAILVIDEAQRLPNLGHIIKGWYDSKISTKIVLLGSSSLDLLNQSAESLTGRNEKLYLPPLLFEEILHHQSWYNHNLNVENLQKNFGASITSMILSQIVYGNYPETVITQNKESYLLNLTSDYLLKDILQSSLVKSPEIIKKLLLLLAFQTGSEVSVNELAQNLGIARPTVEHYLDLLEQTFVIFRLGAFSTNLRKEIAKNTKIFFWDTGIRNALLKEFSFSQYRSDIGALWENWVISEFAKRNLLRGRDRNLYFWRTRDGSEVDLIIKGTHVFEAYEIKWSKTSTKHSHNFSKRYGIPVKIINQANAIEFLLSSDINKLSV